MAIAVNNSTKVATISGTSEGAPDAITAVLDAIAVVDSANSVRVSDSGILRGTWQIAFATNQDCLRIPPFFSLELRDTAAIQMTGRIILGESSTLIVARSTGLGTGNLATFQNSLCKLITERRSQSINPRVIINCGGTNARSDLFGSNSTAIAPVHSIRGLDIVLKGTNLGVFKFYFGAGAIGDNIAISGDSASTALQFFSSAIAENNAPLFVNTLFVNNTVSGDSAAEPRFVRFKKSVHLQNTALGLNTRATALIFVDPDFRSGLPTGYGVSNGGTFQAPIEIRYSYNLKIVDDAGGGINGVKVLFRRSDGTETQQTSNNQGIVAEQELRSRFVAGVPGGTRSAGTFEISTWRIRGRHYLYRQAIETYHDGEVVTVGEFTVTMIPDGAISLTEVQASLLPGIVIDKSSKTITTTGDMTLDAVYQFYKYWITQWANFDTDQFAIASGSTLQLINGWDLTIAGGLLSGGSNLKTVLMDGDLVLSGSGDHAITITDRNRTYRPAAVFTGFPLQTNRNGVSPFPVFGIRDTVTGQTQTYSISVNPFRLKLSTIGDGPFEIVADAIGWVRTPVISIGADATGYDFAPVFQERLEADGTPVIGKQPPSSALTINPTNQRFELTGGEVEFHALAHEFEIESSAAEALWGSGNLRDFNFVGNDAYRRLIVPAPWTIAAVPDATESPRPLDFSVERSDGADPLSHGLPSTAAGLTHRPEVIVRSQINVTLTADGVWADGRALTWRRFLATRSPAKQ